MKNLRKKLCQSRKGFTLLEVLVGSAVGVVLLGLLLVISQNILESYSRSLRSNTMGREAGFILDMISHDLESLNVPRSTGDAEGLRLTMETVNNSTFPWLTFISNARDRDSSGQTSDTNFNGAPRAVSYRVAYQDTVRESGTNPSYALYRAISSAKETFEDALGKTDLLTEYWNDPDRPTTALQDFVAPHVVALDVALLLENGERVSPDADGTGFRITRAGVHRTSGSDLTLLPGKLAGAEISVTLVSAQGAANIQSGALTVEQAVERFGSTYSRRLGIISTGLGDQL